MLDIRFIREHADEVQQAVQHKNYNVDVSAVLKADEYRRDIQQKAEVLRTRRNEISGAMKGGRPSQELVDEGKILKNELSGVEESLRQADEAFITLLKQVPNVPLSDVPIGSSEDENVVDRQVGTVPVFDFAPKNHAEIAIAKGWLDKDRAAKVAGSRFAYLKGDLVQLQLAIEQFVIAHLSSEAVIKEIVAKAGLDGVSTKPFTPVLPPLMIRTEAYDQMDRLEPRDDRYKIEGEELWLQGSAEHVLGSMHAGEIFEETDLPIRYLGLATSFRKEAGTYGKDMEGIIRMHQFDKLEMESFATAETALSEHLLFVAIQEYLLQALKLPYQVLLKCTADIGKPNARGVDMEVWLPGQGKYRETHTADYMTDYQARRLATRVRRAESGILELIHTNDATAFALGRIMVAIIENNQTADGDVIIPEVLRPFMAGRELI
jgi:seryl-tRNA synthetase